MTIKTKIRTLYNSEAQAMKGTEQLWVSVLYF